MNIEINKILVVYNHWTGTVDWNGGIANSAKIRSKVTVLCLSEGIRIIQIDSSLTNYTQKR